MIVLAFLVGVPAVNATDPNNGVLTGIIGYGSIVLAFVLWQVLKAARRGMLKASATSVYHFYCQACGRRFEERIEGTRRMSGEVVAEVGGMAGRGAATIAIAIVVALAAAFVEFLKIILRTFWDVFFGRR